MSFLKSCGVCCMLLSIWAVIQLVVMGIFYYIEATPLIGDVTPHVYSDYNDFIKKTTSKYHSVAMNCWIAAVIYVFMIGISLLCIAKAKRIDRRKALAEEDDDLVCGPLEQSPKKKNVPT